MNKKISTILAQNIKQRRLAMNISQEQLAEIINASKLTIAWLETEKRWISAEMLERLASAFNCQPYELLKDKAPSPNQ